MVFFLESRNKKYLFLQSGVIDDSILCADCDNDIGNKWDKYGIEILRNNKHWLKRTYPDIEKSSYYLLQEYNYKRMKLFFISIIWRMSVSNHTAYCNVNLGRYEKLAYAMLKEENPDSSEVFSINIWKLCDSHSPETLDSTQNKINSLIGPNKIRFSNINYYFFSFGGFMITIKADQRKHKDNFGCFNLSPDNGLKIIEIPFEGSLFQSYLLNLKKFYTA